MSQRDFTVTGPFWDATKQGQPKEWYLRYSAPQLGPDGTPILGHNGHATYKRSRPYYAI
jgi:hypothetical protein